MQLHYVGTWSDAHSNQVIGEHVDEVAHRAHVEFQIVTTQWVDEHVKASHAHDELIKDYIQLWRISNNKTTLSMSR